jgi:integrase/recombinase XerC
MQVQQFIEYLDNVKRYSPHTLVAYREDLRQFLAFCGMQEEEDFSKITTKIVRKWLMAEMRGGLRTDTPGKRLSASSGRRKLSSVKAFFRFLVKTGELEVNPAVDISSPKMSKKLPIFLDEEQMTDLLDRQMDGTGGFSSLRDRLLMLMLYETGIRRSEIVGLRVGDVDFIRRSIRVCGKGGKQREVPMITELMEDAKCYLEVRSGVIEYEHGQFFVTNEGNPIYANFVYRLVTKHLNKMEFLSKRSPHVLRHTCATHLLHNGASIQGIRELLGHSSLAATQVYTHNSIENMLKNFKQAHPRA